MEEKHTAIIGFENGAEIVTGLNILAAIILRQSASPAIEEVYQRFDKNEPLSRDKFKNLIIAAIEHITEINKALENTGITPKVIIEEDDNG